MRTYKARRRSIRQRIWAAMRNLQRSKSYFNIPDLCKVVEGATVANAQSYVSRLFKEGFVSKIGQHRRGYIGEYQSYQLVKDIGPTMPVFLKGRHKKETDTEQETEKQTNEVVEYQDVAKVGKLFPVDAGGSHDDQK